MVTRITCSCKIINGKIKFLLSRVAENDLNSKDVHRLLHYVIYNIISITTSMCHPLSTRMNPITQVKSNKLVVISIMPGLISLAAVHSRF